MFPKRVNIYLYKRKKRESEEEGRIKRTLYNLAHTLYIQTSNKSASNTERQESLRQRRKKKHSDRMKVYHFVHHIGDPTHKNWREKIQMYESEEDQSGRERIRTNG